MSKEKMKVALLYGIKNLKIEETDIPEVGPGEVLVKIKAATTCGTDLKIFQRGYVSGIIELPTVFGHEWAGEVVEVGSGVSWPEIGMRIRAGNSAPCLRCVMCRKGNYNLCEDMLWLWGAYAEYIKVPKRTIMVNAQEIPPHVSFEEAALTEPLACVLHGISKAGVNVGDNVVILGAGPIGFLHMLCARKLGAGKIIMVDKVDERLDYASKLGADVTINAGKCDVVSKVKELTNGYGADLVIEAIGLPATWEQALKMVRRGGTVLEFGGCPPGTEIKVSTELLHYGEVRVLGTFHATPADFKKALDLIASGTINVKPLITRKMRLEEISKAFELLMTSKKDLKIAIIP